MTKAPMIDFSVVSRNGVAALAGDQYIVSVAHNGGYNNVDLVRREAIPISTAFLTKL
ncbi:adhesion and penetration protein [Neisseria gonorrhoeae]|uniref:Adhesion and penetration protein n=1 Tax=Neisseria gonorrhoeae TaxID=485 RepID=A0A378W2N5_NEIGO|nr:adhesion and penetration protein [Neisseria gonorrhoeae]